MTLNEYQIAAGDTDKITPEVFSRNYYALGCAGEAGEALEKALGLTSNDNPEYIKSFILELGDILWYSARFAFAVKGSRSLSNTEANAFQDACEVAFQKNFKAARGHCVMMAITAGKICDIIKKKDRDNGGMYNKTTEDTICKLCIEMLNYSAKACSAVEVKFEDCLQMNLSKLASRKVRGVINGSGDER